MVSQGPPGHGQPHRSHRSHRFSFLSVFDHFMSLFTHSHFDPGRREIYGFLTGLREVIYGFRIMVIRSYRLIRLILLNIVYQVVIR